MTDPYEGAREFLANPTNYNCVLLAWLSNDDVRRIGDGLNWDHEKMLIDIKYLASLKQAEQEEKEIAAVRQKYERKRRCLN